jgi:hypothetical protein
MPDLTRPMRQMWMLVRQDEAVDRERPLPVQDRVLGLTPEQGGRRSGPPATPARDDDAATAFVPPEAVASWLASRAAMGLLSPFQAVGKGTLR